VHQLFIDFMKAYDSIRREVLYNILVNFGILVKLIRLVKMCLKETYSRVRVGKLLSDIFIVAPCILKSKTGHSPTNALFIKLGLTFRNSASYI
jgi:hypothetical protein